MKEKRDVWRERFAHMRQLDFPEFLRERILDEAARREQAGWGRPRRRTKGAWKSGLAGLAGVGAAAVVAGVVWTDHSLPAVNTPLVPTSASQQTQQPLSDSQAMGLQAAQFSVTGIQVVRQPGSPNGATVVQATVANIGKTVIKPSDVVGVLGFSQHPTRDLLASSNWLAFVNGPSQPLAPAQTATWSFHAIGVPVNAAGDVVGQPSLAFFNAKTVSPSRADKVLAPQAGVQLQSIDVVKRLAWSTARSAGRSFDMTATLVNHGNKPVSLANLLTIVWFSPKPGEPWTAHGVERFFDQVQTVKPGSQEVLPGHAARVVLPPLIGSYTPDFLQWNVNVVVIGHHW